MPAMVMNAPANGSSGVGEGSEASTSTSSRLSSQKQMAFRRRRSKGTIAGFASSTSGTPTKKDSTATVSHDTSNNSDSGGSAVGSLGTDNASSSADGRTNQPQHVNDTGTSSNAPPAPPKPCHSSKLALLCVQNAIHMGARTQLNLCPPGRAREVLRKSLLEKRRKKAHAASGLRRMTLQRVPSLTSMGSRIEESSTFDRTLGDAGIAEYARAEDDYLNNPVLHSLDLNNEGKEIVEEASSGDEDALDLVLDDLDGLKPPLGKETLTFKEPLYTLGSDATGGNAQSTGGGMGSASSNKFAFNRRKLKWFDAVTASDRAAARQYLRQEMANLKKKDIMMLTTHLKKLQRREKRSTEIGKGRRNITEFSLTDNFYSEDEDEKLTESIHAGTGAIKLPTNMTPGLSAALVLESLELTHLESLEGMSKCYEGIVAAGTALLDSEIDDPTAADKKKPSRTEIMNALAPLLITTLEHSSGETILALAKLRKQCGTKRYQRRFVQRIAPSLVRPPSAAMWCLRHQNDMESILAATEMIFDASFEVFASGWHDRGLTLLADSQRAETLKAAAMQLKQLSAQQTSDCILKGLNTVPGSHRRGTSLMIGSTPTKDCSGTGQGGGTELLAEWEVLAVDRQIRQSINNLFTKDWSRVVLSNALLRDSDSHAGHRFKTRGISAGKAKSTIPPDTALQVDIVPAPMEPPSSNVTSPPRVALSKSPLLLSPNSSPSLPNPHGVIPGNPPTVDTLESVFGPSFTSNLSNNSTLPISGPPPPSMEDINNEMLKPRRSTSGDGLTPPQTPSQNHTAGTIDRTPPRSPVSPPRTSGSGLPAPSSPPKKKATSTPPLGNQPIYGNELVATAPQMPSISLGAVDMSRMGLGPAPLSPSNPYGTQDRRYVSSNASTGSTGSVSVTSQQTMQNTYLRTLTSTAAERKRTVAACRALRAQISRFEEAFKRIHGRSPKGTAERAPLSTTYAQYREWKRAIRADAACRIQALCRGAHVRVHLLKNGNDSIKRLIRNKSGRPGYKSTPTITDNNVLRRLSIPVDVVGNVAEDGLRSSSMEGTPRGVSSDDASSEASGYGVEVFINNPNSAAGSSQNWNSSTVPKPIRRNSGEDSASFAGPVSNPQHSIPYPSVNDGGVSGAGANYNELSLTDLQARKRELKQQLKQYDMDFHSQHGRMPRKAEKEPIRHLYENYNALKSRISLIERDGGSSIHSTPSRRGGSLSGYSDANSSGDDSSSNIVSTARSKRKEKLSSGINQPSSPGGTNTPSGTPSQDLAVLKAEKQKLHQMLRSYEKDFLKMHNRQVSSYADIRPVASQYRRYKEIKKAIAAQQQATGEK